jgi:signal transduction histidine kinase/DNA-binding response OmpR family regulator
MRLFSIPRWLGLTIPGALIVLTWVGIVWHLRNEEAQYRNDAEQRSRTIAGAYAEHIDMSIRLIDQTLGFLRTAYEHDPDHFDITSGIKNSTALGDLSGTLAIFDANGILQLSSRGKVTSRVDISDRDDFLVHKNRPTDDLYISTLTLGRLTNIWTLKYTRRLSKPDGSFAGIISFSARPNQLLQPSPGADPGPNGALALVGLDGVFRARWPDLSEAQGQLNSQVRAQSAIPAAARKQTSGTMQIISSFDLMPRIVSFRRIGKYGMVVAVGLSTADILAPYNQDRTMAVTIGLALTLAFALAWVISARQQTRLAQTRVALEATLENIRQGILMIDAHGRIPVINRRAIELLGLPNHILGPKLTWDRILQWQLDTDEFREGIVKGPGADVDDMIRSGGILNGWDRYERRRPNGHVLDIQTTLLPDGGAVQTYTDVTENRAVEAALEAARDAAEAANHGRAVFLAMMSHEIRTPMNGVIGMASLLLSTPLTDDQMRLARTVHESAEFLLEIIDDILTFSKLEANEIILDETTFAPRDVLPSVISTFALQARTKGLGLSWTVADSVPAFIRCDVGRLRQVLFNLIGNAIKFTETGRVTVHVEANEPHGTLTNVTWSVMDSGIGIAQIAQPDLFREFWQADRSTSRRFGGTGLGLAICRRLIERMGGTIAVESEIGRGSTFRFVIPMTLAHAPNGQQEEEEYEAPEVQRSLSVLLAEDNRVNQMVAQRVLEQLGHRVDVVVDGRAALTAAKTQRYDLILMDMMMPELDGIAATKAIRALPDPAAASVPILALTANALPRDREVCLAAGMNGYISKPVRPHQLATAIAQLLAPAGPQLPLPFAQPESSNQTATFDSGVIDQLAEDIGQEGAMMVLDAFIEDAPKRLESIAAAALNSDGEGMRLELHTLKSASASVGFMGVSALSSELEMKAAGLDPDGMHAASLTLNEQFAVDLAVAMASSLRQTSSAPLA